MNPPVTTVLNVSEESCNGYYACSLNRGKSATKISRFDVYMVLAQLFSQYILTGVTQIGYYSCNGIDACNAIMGKFSSKIITPSS